MLLGPSGQISVENFWIGLKQLGSGVTSAACSEVFASSFHSDKGQNDWSPVKEFYDPVLHETNTAKLQIYEVGKKPDSLSTEYSSRVLW